MAAFFDSKLLRYLLCRPIEPGMIIVVCRPDNAVTIVGGIVPG